LRGGSNHGPVPSQANRRRLKTEKGGKLDWGTPEHTSFLIKKQEKKKSFFIGQGMGKGCFSVRREKEGKMEQGLFKVKKNWVDSQLL